LRVSDTKRVVHIRASPVGLLRYIPVPVSPSENLSQKTHFHIIISPFLEIL
jgi:hypothetical protein